jgi:hypothetical protein
MRLDSSKRLLVGTASARPFHAGIGSATPKVQIEGTGDESILSITRNSADIGTPRLVLGKSRGSSSGSTTAVQADDYLGQISFEGTNGTSFNQAARIDCLVDGAVSGGGAGDMPGRLVFSTTADGASSPTERMRITKQGALKISNTGSYLSNDSSPHEIRSNVDNNNVLIVSSDASNGTQYGLSIRTTDDQNDATRDFLGCQGGDVLRAQIRSNGGLANYSANNANLSDRNAKKDISPATDTWNCLKEWEIVNYRYKDQSADADLNLGVIAQQVAESCPEVITIFQEAKGSY